MKFEDEIDEWFIKKFVNYYKFEQILSFNFKSVTFKSIYNIFRLINDNLKKRTSSILINDERVFKHHHNIKNNLSTTNFDRKICIIYDSLRLKKNEKHVNLFLRCDHDINLIIEKSSNDDICKNFNIFIIVDNSFAFASTFHINVYFDINYSITSNLNQRFFCLTKLFDNRIATMLSSMIIKMKNCL